MSTIKIMVNASIYPPSSQLAIGPHGNPRIFSGKFEISIPDIPELPDYWKTVKQVRVRGILLYVVGKSKDGDMEKMLYAQSHLNSVESEHFTDLRFLGWDLDVRAATDKGYPVESLPTVDGSTIV